ncbi:SIR2 family protein [Bradyrhizobium sp. 183]|uniref:SIR2 family protein n=1 Tax=unclassified Bradyrhizobium TaxID=2631580 RepID=UPI001FFEE4FB|nr:MULTISPECIES: SIR2 family protein [unclassified Bradyrhizobium]UPJ79481.1 SIR2 family protein [Bradyrhizobium sp. 184]UPJ87277.1 SIR2 family protein [Bradyrhizobium sp. 183]
MSILSGDPITQLAFSMFENKGVYALLLGSGLSRSAGIPTGWEITLDLVRRVALAQGVENQSDWAVWYREQNGTDPDYSALLAELAISAAERRSILHSYIEPDDEDRAEGKKLPTAAHHAIAGLVRDGYVRVIVTTNFDRLLENALREIGVEPTVVTSVDTLLGAEPITHSACYVLKLHGDYKDARILNTDEELAAYPPQYDGLLDRIFDEHGLLVCGWSGDWDDALRAALLRVPSRRYPAFWGIRGKPGSGADAIISQRKAVILPITDADDFFVTLGERVKTLAETRKQSPLTIDLLVGSVKRYIARPEFRIRLDEVITQEANKLFDRLGVKELSPQGSWSVDEFRRRLKVYEAATEPLAKAFGILGRWGDDTELATVADTIRGVVARANEVGSGLNVWLGLRTYPAVLLMTAYGLGLVRAERWKILHDLFSLSMPREDRDPKRVVNSLFLWDWKGWDDNLWNNVEGFTTGNNRRKTPLSDHLLDIFSEWGDAFLGIPTDNALLFDRFEALGALAHLEEISESSLKDQLEKGDRKARMSVGRLGWRSDGRRSIEHELKSTATRQQLLKAGFAFGSEAYLELFLENLTRVAGWMEWH